MSIFGKFNSNNNSLKEYNWSAFWTMLMYKIQRVETIELLFDRDVADIFDYWKRNEKVNQKIYAVYLAYFLGVNLQSLSKINYVNIIKACATKLIQMELLKVSINNKPLVEHDLKKFLTKNSNIKYNEISCFDLCKLWRFLKRVILFN